MAKTELTLTARALFDHLKNEGVINRDKAAAQVEPDDPDEERVPGMVGWDDWSTSGFHSDDDSESLFSSEIEEKIPDDSDPSFIPPTDIDSDNDSDLVFKAVQQDRVSCISESEESQDSVTFPALRKQIATISQVVNLKDHELDVLADFMGHDVRIHREFYRLPQQTYQVAKVSKLLLALEKGDLATIRGKTLDDITVSADDVLDDEDDDDNDEDGAPTIQATSFKQQESGSGACAARCARDGDSDNLHASHKGSGACAARCARDGDSDNLHASHKDLALVLQGVHVMGILIIYMLLIKDLALVLQGVHVMGILIIYMLLIKDLALVLQGVHVMGILIINILLIKGLWPEKRRSIDSGCLKRKKQWTIIFPHFC